MNRGLIRKRILSITGMLLICLIILSSIPPVTANPFIVYIPNPGIGITPYTITNSSIQFTHEYIHYSIVENNQIYVNARYTFDNPTNVTEDITLVFPYVENIPQNMSMFSDNISMPFYIERVGTSPYGLDDYYPYYAVLNLTVTPYPHVPLEVEYLIDLEVDKSLFTTTYSTGYLTETTQYWNTPPNGTFDITIPKEKYSYGLEEILFLENNESFTFRISNITDHYEDNINISWTTYNYTNMMLVILAIAVVIILSVIVIKKRINPRKSEEPDPGPPTNSI